jgi:hypothetical protein
MLTIKAAVVREKSAAFRLEDIELDDPRDNEVLGDCRIFGLGGHPAGGLSVNESASSLRVHR